MLVLRKIVSWFLCLTTCYCTIVHQNSVYAANCDHSRGSTDNELMPNAKLIFTPGATEHISGSILGEVGRRNYRINGTLGFLIGNDNFLKFSGEYLTQKLGYRFSSGKVETWRNQSAVGGAYQRQFNTQWIDNAEVQGYYSVAPSHDLHRKKCPEFCGTLRRQIAGSHAGGGLFGLTFIPWQSGLLQLRANYDHVVYQRKYHSNLHVSGFGGTANWFQKLGCYVDFAVKAEIRRPFNYFEGLINWHAPKDWRGFSLGLFGSHTHGKSHLPNNTSAGIQLSYLLGFKNPSNELPRSDQLTKTCIHPATPFNSALVSWVSTPAVYMPEVLAIADQRKKGFCSPSPSCTPPTSQSLGFFFATIGTQIDVSGFFNDPTGTNPLTFALVGDPPGFFVIDPTTGVITAVLDPPIISDFTVTATNACGTTSQPIRIVGPI